MICGYNQKDRQCCIVKCTLMLCTRRWTLHFQLPWKTLPLMYVYAVENQAHVPWHGDADTMMTNVLALVNGIEEKQADTSSNRIKCFSQRSIDLEITFIYQSCLNSLTHTHYKSDKAPVYSSTTSLEVWSQQAYSMSKESDVCLFQSPLLCCHNTLKLLHTVFYFLPG